MLIALTDFFEKRYRKAKNKGTLIFFILSQKGLFSSQIQSSWWDRGQDILRHFQVTCRYVFVYYLKVSDDHHQANLCDLYYSEITHHHLLKFFGQRYNNINDQENGLAQK